jgi:RNA polymerase sigma factor (TIGR02999 family)
LEGQHAGTPALSALFAAAERGDRPAADALFATLYAELHRLAARQVARGGSGAALGTTSLLHEVYLEMSQREGATFPDRPRFLGYAARVMRGLIIDAVRRKQAEKRGGGFEITGIEGREIADRSGAELERLSSALDELASLEPALAEIVDWKYFCGFTFAEIAALKGSSERTVQRDWAKARLLLRGALDDVEAQRTER